ncbi:MAG: aa3-type cytochrome c oxidase subunit IV [Alphaproteobacteria bacterium]|nr:aa3-type cytochrome c oxidase subunit IV [Alphaproteobacteria bacterium]MBV9372969.1 aa3-type cytochrome c oxidase subunit IV [Alphaproteobacteria bacterium]MBV9901336.1 aa3-type cytochrome c oxidase subunit IV [Alphaproteobacteria bacterium]
MAAEGEMDQEIVVHRKGYEGFLTFFKVGAAISFVIAFIVILIISN